MTIEAATSPDAVTLTAAPAAEGGAFAEPQASENRATGQAETADLANPALP